jgi:hypothetical protein
MKDNQWLQDAVLEHIKNNPGVERIEVLHHFNLRVDITLEAIHDLLESSLIYSRWFPLQLPQGTTRLYV